MYKAIWITRPPGVFRLDWMIYGALVGLELYGLLSVLRLPASTILVSALAGMSMLPPIAMNMVIGYLMRLILERIIGKEIYNKYKFTIVAGISAGSGLAVTLGISDFLILRSITFWFY